MLRVSVIDRKAEFAGLREAWDELVKRSDNPTPFVTWGWLYSWWKYYSNGKRLHILSVWDDNELVGVAPFFRQNKRWLDVMPVRKLGFLGSEYVTSDYQDVLVSASRAKEARRAIWQYLSSKYRRGWDVISLSSVPEFSPTLKEIESLRNVLHVQLLSTHVCQYAQLPDAYEKYVGGLSRKWRYTMRKKERAISEAFQLEHARVRDQGELKAMVSDLATVHMLGRSARGKKWSFRSDRFRGFVEDVCRVFLETAALELCFLKVNGQPISGLIGFRTGDTLFVYQQGIHPDYLKWSPGTVIFGRCVQAAIAKGIREIDFLRGGEDYKRHWAKQERKNVEVCVFNRTWRGILLAMCLRLGKYVLRALPKAVKARSRQL